MQKFYKFIGKKEFLKLMEEKEKLIPENRRKACMETFGKHVETFSPDWFEEFSGMDRALELFPSFAIFEIDMGFSELTTFFFAFGMQQKMIAIPPSVGAFALPEDMFSGKWTATGFAFKQKAGMDHTKLTELSAVENELRSEYRIVREQARIVLCKGERAEASGLLRNTVKNLVTAMLCIAKNCFVLSSQSRCGPAAQAGCRRRNPG